MPLNHGSFVSRKRRGVAFGGEREISDKHSARMDISEGIRYLSSPIFNGVRGLYQARAPYSNRRSATRPNGKADEGLTGWWWLSSA